MTLAERNSELGHKVPRYSSVPTIVVRVPFVCWHLMQPSTILDLSGIVLYDGNVRLTQLRVNRRSLYRCNLMFYFGGVQEAFQYKDRYQHKNSYKMICYFNAYLERCSFFMRRTVFPRSIHVCHISKRWEDLDGRYRMLKALRNCFDETCHRILKPALCYCFLGIFC